MVIDEAIAVFGSFALSASSLDGRREVGIVIRTPELVAKLNRQFENAAVQTAKVSAQVA